MSSISPKLNTEGEPCGDCAEELVPPPLPGVGAAAVDPFGVTDPPHPESVNPIAMIKAGANALKRGGLNMCEGNSWGRAGATLRGFGMIVDEHRELHVDSTVLWVEGSEERENRDARFSAKLFPRRVLELARQLLLN